MPKKIISAILIVLAGIAILCIHPLRINEDPSTLISSQGVQDDFVKYKNLEHRNQISIVLTDTQTDIFNPVFLNTLQKLTEDIFYLPNVDRTHISSIFTHNLNFTDVVAGGFEASALIPENFSNSKIPYDQIKSNILKSPYLGKLVSNDFKSALICIPYFGDENGQKLTQEIKHLLPQNDRLRFSLLGYAPFILEVRRAFNQSIVLLLISWVISIFLFCIVTRKFTPFFLLFLGPLSTVILVCVVCSIVSFSFTPIVFPVLMITLILSFIDIAWILLNSKKTPAPTLNAYVLWPVISLCCLGSSFGFQIAFLVLAATLCLCLTHQLFLRSFAPLDTSGFLCRISLQPIFSLRIKNLLSIILLVIGLILSSKTFIGNPAVGSNILKDNTSYRKTAKLATNNFSFSLDSILVLAISNNGPVDCAAVNALEEFNWTLTQLPAVRSVWSLADAVKKLNVFFHENNPKWKIIPREKKTLIAATSVLDASSGLMDDDALIMPVTIFLENQTPQTLAEIYKSIEKFKTSQKLLTLKIVGGTVGINAIGNEELVRSVKIILLGFLLIVFLITLQFFPVQTTLKLYFLFLVILSLTLGLMATTKIGLTLDTVLALGVCSSLCLYFLWLLQRNHCDRQKLTLILFLACLMICGALFSEINFIFRTATIAEGMLILTWLVGFNFIPEKERN